MASGSWWKLGVWVVLALSVSGRASALPMLVFDIAGQGQDATIDLGEAVTVAIFADEIPSGTDGNGLFGFGFRILHDADGLSHEAVEGDPVLDSLWTGLSDSANAPGNVGITANLLGEVSGPSVDPIPLATIVFIGETPGLYPLTLTHFTGPGDNILFDGTILDVPGSEFFTEGSIRVIPEPSTSLLTLVGLALLATRAHARTTLARVRR